MSSLPVLRTWNADRDLEAIWLHVSKYNHRAADRLIRRLTRKFSQLSVSPDLGEREPRLGERIRRVIVDRYLVFYERGDDAITIVRVIHSARRWEDLL
jgi:toxin ParE1/3/4